MNLDGSTGPKFKQFDQKSLKTTQEKSPSKCAPHLDPCEAYNVNSHGLRPLKKLAPIVGAPIVELIFLNKFFTNDSRTPFEYSRGLV